jgi:hypothetical protein
MILLGHVAKEVNTSETSDKCLNLRKRICQSTSRLGTEVRITTRPWAQRTWGSNPGMGKRFLSSPRQALGPTQTHIQRVQGWLPGGLGGRGVESATHFHLGVSLRMIVTYNSAPPICLRDMDRGSFHIPQYEEGLVQPYKCTVRKKNSRIKYKCICGYIV